MCNLADAPKSVVIQYSGGSLPSSSVLGPGEWLKFQCEEGYSAPGTPYGPTGFTVTCEDGITFSNQWSVELLPCPGMRWRTLVLAKPSLSDRK